MLARKITRSKWTPKPYLSPEGIRADAITGCLRTKDDSLSLWRCTSDGHEIDQVFLALATGPLNSDFDTMDIVLVPENNLVEEGLIIEGIQGDTTIENLRLRHVDLVQLDLDKLGKFAKLLAARIRESHVRRKTVAQIKELVRNALSTGILRRDELNEGLRAKI